MVKKVSVWMDCTVHVMLFLACVLILSTWLIEANIYYSALEACRHSLPVKVIKQLI